ncbi:Glucose-1-phosphatase/inositol phosphatase, partial [Operophtera brumata]
MAGKVTCVILALGICNAYGLELKQMLIFSRHNLRTPLTGELQSMSPKIWPKWKYEPGELTEKGALLEGYLGEYFAEWMQYQGLIPDGCPEADSVFVYANTRQRCKDTAKAFDDAAFRNCSIAVNSKNTTEMDPIFNPIIHNSSEAFKEQVISEIRKKLNEIDLKDVYLELNRITNIKDSQICKEESYCDLVNDTDDIVFQIGIKPKVAGPLFIANGMVDSFLM